MLNLEIFSVSWFSFEWHFSIEGNSPARGGQVWRTGDRTVCSGHLRIRSHESNTKIAGL